MNTTEDNNFEKFRRERRQRRAQFGNQPATAAKANAASEVEAYEARQMHETRLSRDVQDFLAEATKQAATIVEKVTQVAEAETAQRLAREMQEFLQETLRRAARFMDLVHGQRVGEALQEIEPHVSNLVGPKLDEFRHEGTAQLRDKHIGQDPFQALEEEPEDDSPENAALEASIAGGVADETGPGEDGGSGDDAPARKKPGVLTEHMFRDAETLKKSLKALVKAGVLSTDDARSMYRNALNRSSAS